MTATAITTTNIISRGVHDGNSGDPYAGGDDSQHVIRVTVVTTKAEVLKENGVPGKGIDDAPGLDKPIPNENFAKHKNFGKGPGPED